MSRTDILYGRVLCTLDMQEFRLGRFREHLPPFLLFWKYRKSNLSFNEYQRYVGSHAKTVFLDSILYLSPTG